METIWLLDRATGLLSYAALYLAVLTGILYNAPGFGPFVDASRRVHIEISVLALLLLLAHGVFGLLDTWFVVTGAVDEPTYGTNYLLAGSTVGVGAFLLVVVGVLGYVDARRFTRPWSPKVVHAFTYGGFAFGTIHAVAVGTDIVAIARPGIVASTVFLVYVLVLRILAYLGLTDGRTSPSA